MTSMQRDVPLPYTLLVVDDEQPILELLDELLVEEGIVPTLAADLPSALAALEQKCFDLILADSLADFRADHSDDRWSALELLRAHAGATPILIFSAHSAGVFEELPARGFAGFIAKPFDLDNLAHTLRVYVEAARSAQQHSDSFLAAI